MKWVTRERPKIDRIACGQRQGETHNWPPAMAWGGDHDERDCLAIPMLSARHVMETYDAWLETGAAPWLYGGERPSE